MVRLPHGEGAPEPISKKLHAATVTTIEDQQMTTGDAGVVPPEKPSTEYFKGFLPKDIEKDAGPIRAAGLAVE